MPLPPPLTLVAVDPDDEAALRARFALAVAAGAADRPEGPPPSLRQHLAGLRHPYPGTRTSVWLARHRDEVVGEAVLGLPTLDNLDNAFAEVVVAPARRRAGIGRALLHHLAVQARDAGRIRLIGEACAADLDGHPGPGEEFVVAAGATPVLAQTCRRLPLPPDEAAAARLGSAARPAGGDYELVQWTGRTPDRWVDDIAELTARMSTDAPLDDLHLAPEVYDTARIRTRDDARRACGLHGVVTAALHRRSGRLVGFTDILVRCDVPWHGGQSDTIVARAHRGHRLGIRMKVANLELARREQPSLTAVDTWNADSNPWMVAINEAMGFRPLRRWTEWELEL
ncbi:MAG TPA: GNAT family N-acetyltransferase [Pseudonocardia sp.]|nr:GNAT family N-acetyltransferase [Pseudonocardia sp.]